MSDKPIKLGHIGKSDGQANRVYSVKGKSVNLIANAGGGVVRPGYTRLIYPMETTQYAN